MAKDFNLKPEDVAGTFNKLLPEKKNRKKTVSIQGENDFSSNALKNPKRPAHKSTKKRGRPVIVTDERYKVALPKKISPALNSKLSILQDYMVEFQSEKGRISFEKIVDALAESYITTKLGVSKEEHIRQEIKEQFDQLNK